MSGVARCATGRLRDEALDHVVAGRVLSGTVGLSGAVIVAGPGDDQSAARRDLAQQGLARLGVLPVIDLEAAQSRVDESIDERHGHHAIPPRGDGVGDDRHSPGVRDEAYRRERIGCVVRFVVPLARMQDAVEGLRAIAHDPSGHERIGDVRAPDRRVRRGLGQHVVPVQVVVAPDAAHDALGAPDTIAADAFRLGAQISVVGVEEVTEYMHAAPLVLGGEFHAGDERHPESVGGFGSLRPACGAVVIGERDRAQPVGVRLAHHLGRRLGTVGLVRVQVQVRRTCESTGMLNDHPPSVPSAPVPGCAACGAARRGRVFTGGAPRLERMLRLLGILFTVLLAAVTAVVVWPQFFRLEQTYPFAQIVAARGVVLAGFIILAVIALLLLLARPLRGFAASVLIVALLGAGATGIIGATRGFGASALPAKTDTSLRVLTWNTAGEAVPAEQIAQQILDQGADIVALPETTEAVGERIALMLREQGHPMWVHHVQFRPDVPNGPQSWQTTVLVSPDLGEYSVIESSEDGSNNTGSVPSVVLMPVDGSGPTVVAVHAVAPRKEEMVQWQADLAWIADQCPQGDFILAGDFNATIDHMATLGVDGGDIGYCRDVASRTGSGLVGTWPSSVPALVGAPIDHVMASQNWTPTGSAVLDDAGGSDHRALIVQLEPAG